MYVSALPAASVAGDLARQQRVLVDLQVEQAYLNWGEANRDGETLCHERTLHVGQFERDGVLAGIAQRRRAGHHGRSFHRVLKSEPGGQHGRRDRKLTRGLRCSKAFGRRHRLGLRF